MLFRSLYDRILNGILEIRTRGKIDLSNYQEMFNKSMESKYEDKTIGII